MLFTGKDMHAIGAENITAGKAFGPEDINGPITSEWSSTGVKWLFVYQQIKIMSRLATNERLGFVLF